MMHLGEFKKLMTLDEAFSKWKLLVFTWGDSAFGKYCEYLVWMGWKVV